MKNQSYKVVCTDTVGVYSSHSYALKIFNICVELSKSGNNSHFAGESVGLFVNNKLTRMY